MSSREQRMIFDGVLLLSLLLAPFFVTLALVFVGFFLYPRYFEAVIAAIFVELLYRGGDGDMFGGYLPLPALTLLTLLLVELLRMFIRERTQ